MLTVIWLLQRRQERGLTLVYSAYDSATAYWLALDKPFLLAGPIRHCNDAPDETCHYLRGLVRHFDSILKDVGREMRAWL